MFNKLKKLTTLQISLLLIVLMTVGGTVAYLAATPKAVENTFNPSSVDVEIEEEFDGTEKTNINVTNTGDIDVYVRVKLVTYRVMESDGKDERIGGTATSPAFTLGTDWVQGSDGFYYYTKLVAPGQSPSAPLADSITLVTYTDADGGRQAIDVIAEAIQPQPKSADNAEPDTYDKAWAVTK